ncbi:MAG: hypothetical protein EOO24_18870 [Comamonadaceae bacterium]|nr:MAG: hypothetical protein EOO24_18870 [Comamonadaceae bacterium]
MPSTMPSPIDPAAAAHMLAELIEQVLGTSVAPHTAALLRVCSDLGLRAYGREGDRLHHALADTLAALETVDYHLLADPGGRRHDPPDLGAFTPRQRTVLQALAPLEALGGDLETALQAQAGPVRRTQAELRDECMQLGSALAPGDNWIGDLWTTLKGLKPAPGDRAGLEDLRRLAETADRLRTRLRGLKAAGQSALEACGDAGRVMDSRATLARLLRNDLRPAVGGWDKAVAKLLDGVRRPDVQLLPVEPAAQAHARLEAVLERGIALCVRLRQDQRAMQRGLAAACEQLRAAAPAGPPRG